MNRGDTHTAFRRPESVLVVVYTRGRDTLLIRRCRPAGYWQSVTGGLHWGESALDAAVRELQEETGIDGSCGLTDTGIVNRYAPLPEFGHRFEPRVTENVEHVWILELKDRVDVTLNPVEHDAFRWLPLSEAANAVDSHTNRSAIRALL